MSAILFNLLTEINAMKSLYMLNMACNDEVIIMLKSGKFYREHIQTINHK